MLALRSPARFSCRSSRVPMATRNLLPSDGFPMTRAPSRPRASPRTWTRCPGCTTHSRYSYPHRSPSWVRSEEHTSELQSRENLVCRLLLEKKKNTTPHTHVQHDET